MSWADEEPFIQNNFTFDISSNQTAYSRAQLTISLLFINIKPKIFSIQNLCNPKKYRIFCKDCLYPALPICLHINPCHTIHFSALSYFLLMINLVLSLLILSYLFLLSKPNMNTSKNVMMTNPLMSRHVWRNQVFSQYCSSSIKKTFQWNVSSTMGCKKVIVEQK